MSVSDLEGNDMELMMTSTGEFSFNVSTSILPFTNYSFSVQACNVIGCSNFDDGIPSEAITTAEDGEWI